jgi:hypothetical protein
METSEMLKIGSGEHTMGKMPVLKQFFKFKSSVTSVKRSTTCEMSNKHKRQKCGSHNGNQKQKNHTALKISFWSVESILKDKVNMCWIASEENLWQQTK